MTAFVLDCSMTVAWAFPEEHTPHTLAVLDLLREGSAFAPALWPLEVANVLVVSERRGRLTEARSRHFIDMLEGLPVSVEEAVPARAWEDCLPLARRVGLTVYDAAYLDLAMRLGLPLATLDKRLQEAAAKVGVRLVA